VNWYTKEQLGAIWMPGSHSYEFLKQIINTEIVFRVGLVGIFLGGQPDRTKANRPVEEVEKSGRDGMGLDG